MEHTRTLLLAGAAGAVLFVVVFLVEGALRPGYDAARQPVSALALGPRGWIQTTNFVVAGALIGAGALGVHRATGATWGAAALGAFAAGLVASGLFPMDRPGAVTTRGALHEAAGMVVFSALPAAAILLGGRLGGGLGFASPVVASACIALFVTFGLAYDRGSDGAGLIQRTLIVVGWGWIATVALHLAR
jgi:hypothetical protein